MLKGCQLDLASQKPEMFFWIHSWLGAVRKAFPCLEDPVV